MRLQEQFEKMHDQIEQLKAKGNKLARYARSLRLSVTAHPYYTGEPNEEWTDLVEGVDNALAEWKGERKPVTGAPVKFDSHWMVGRSEERFKELEHKKWDWRSFYNGWIEGRADAVHDVLRREQAARQGAVWVKASEFKYELNTPYHAKDEMSKGAGQFIDDEGGGVLFVWGDGSDTFASSFHKLYILDESAGEKEVINGGN